MRVVGDEERVNAGEWSEALVNVRDVRSIFERDGVAEDDEVGGDLQQGVGDSTDQGAAIGELKQVLGRTHARGAATGENCGSDMRVGG